jgi:flagellar hook-length control protein FliK
MLSQAPVPDSQKLPDAAPTKPAPHAHSAASGAPSASAPARAGDEASDDSQSGSDAERKGRTLDRNSGTANAAEDTPAKSHGRASPHIDVRLDDSVAAPKPVDALEATSAARLPELFSSAPSAAAPAAIMPSPGDAAPIQIAGLAVEIAAHAQAGRNRFEIRLDPPELGRIDVRLDVDNSGNVTSRLVVERVETLEILRRDAGELQRALQDAGLKTSDNGLQFTLRDQNFAGRNDRAPTQPSARLIIPDASVPETVPDYGRVIRRGLDIRV